MLREKKERELPVFGEGSLESQSKKLNRSDVYPGRGVSPSRGGRFWGREWIHLAPRDLVNVISGKVAPNWFQMRRRGIVNNKNMEIYPSEEKGLQQYISICIVRFIPYGWQVTKFHEKIPLWTRHKKYFNTFWKVNNSINN